MTSPQAGFPRARPRRLRRTPSLRALVGETRLGTSDLIWPVFLRDGTDMSEPIASMPGVNRLSVDRVVLAAKRAVDLGIPAICLFPYTDPSVKTELCEEAWNPDNLTNRAIRAIKSAVPDIAVMTDIALDPYNANGHDGIVRDGEIVNDETVEALVRMALAQADSGADILGPSDMMDHRIGAMRDALEAKGHQHVTIMSYSAKYASAFYGPFRDAVGASGALKGDKATYQIDPGNGDEALQDDCPRSGRGRRYGHGQTRAGLSGHLPPGQRDIRRSDIRLSGLGRIRDDPGCGAKRLDRRRKGNDGKPAGLPSARAATAS